jgi:hypothetical protein
MQVLSFVAVATKVLGCTNDASVMHRVCCVIQFVINCATSESGLQMVNAYLEEESSLFTF